MNVIITMSIVHVHGPFHLIVFEDACHTLPIELLPLNWSLLCRLPYEKVPINLWKI